MLLGAAQQARAREQHDTTGVCQLRTRARPVWRRLGLYRTAANVALPASGSATPSARAGEDVRTGAFTARCHFAAA